ncbi:oxidoreductase, partial [Salmonella enterica subsp. enterica serovar Poona]
LRDSTHPHREVRGGPDGDLYVLTDESDGQLLKVSPAATR